MSSPKSTATTWPHILRSKNTQRCDRQVHQIQRLWIDNSCRELAARANNPVKHWPSCPWPSHTEHRRGRVLHQWEQSAATSRHFPRNSCQLWKETEPIGRASWLAHFSAGDQERSSASPNDRDKLTRLHLPSSPCSCPSSSAPTSCASNEQPASVSFRACPWAQVLEDAGTNLCACIWRVRSDEF